jgi:hypothetical protein
MNPSPTHRSLLAVRQLASPMSLSLQVVVLALLGVRGEEVFVFFWSDLALLAITPDGGMRVVPDPRLPAPDSVACPALETFKGTRYGRCWRFKDAATNAVRRLAYEVPCDAD